MCHLVLGFWFSSQKRETWNTFLQGQFSYHNICNIIYSLTNFHRNIKQKWKYYFIFPNCLSMCYFFYIFYYNFFYSLIFNLLYTWKIFKFSCWTFSKFHNHNLAMTMTCVFLLLFLIAHHRKGLREKCQLRKKTSKKFESLNNSRNVCINLRSFLFGRWYKQIQN